MSDQANNSVLALLAGLAIGAGLGILFAPDSGKNTRDKIKSGVDDYSDDLKAQLKDLSSKIRSKVTKSGNHSDLIDDLLADANEETESLIANLEVKLALLKEQLAEKQKLA